jgi:hypothetical protein
MEWHQTFFEVEPDTDESAHGLMEVAWAEDAQGQRTVRFRSEDDSSGFIVQWEVPFAHEIARAILACPLKADDVPVPD